MSTLPPGFMVVAGYSEEGTSVVFVAQDGFQWVGPRRSNEAAALADALEQFEICPHLYYAEQLVDAVRAIDVIEGAALFYVHAHDDDPVETRRGLLLFTGQDAAWLRSAALTKMEGERRDWVAKIQALALPTDDLAEAFERVFAAKAYLSVEERDRMMPDLLDRVAPRH